MQVVTKFWFWNKVSLGKIFPLDREKNDTCSLFTKYLLNVLKAWKPSLRAPKVSVNVVTLLARKLTYFSQRNFSSQNSLRNSHKDIIDEYVQN